MTMRSGWTRLARLLTGAWLVVGAAAFGQSAQDAESALRELELERVRLLVAADIAAADPLHADDFVLTNPFGAVLSRADFLGALEAGVLVFLHWELSDVEVRIYGAGAAIRHRSTILVELQGEVIPETELWHIVTYELRGGAWQAVWSLATEIREMP